MGTPAGVRSLTRGCSSVGFYHHCSPLSSLCHHRSFRQPPSTSRTSALAHLRLLSSACPLIGDIILLDEKPSSQHVSIVLFHRRNAANPPLQTVSDSHGVTTRRTLIHVALLHLQDFDLSASPSSPRSGTSICLLSAPIPLSSARMPVFLGFTPKAYPV